MTTELSAIQSFEPQTLGESRGPAVNLNNDFQKYLDEEQKRLVLLFSPFNQFDFSAWFNYQISTDNQTGRQPKVNLFADINRPPVRTKTSEPGPTAKSITDANPANVNFSQLLADNRQLTRQLLQNILAQTGWLVPNLGAVPQFQSAQLQGKLLATFDLQALVDQIVSQVKMVKEKGKVELNLGLKPENLGEIFLTLSAQTGNVAIQIQASAETKKLLEQRLVDLEAALKKAHVNFTEIKIIETQEAKDHA
ncbi:flagellar hook-length control protein FliK [Candidatus Saganbacteria bacterium]|nr:flagellar hook-length control protein FliK [Candidatus Saganbacteria bacterium]